MAVGSLSRVIRRTLFHLQQNEAGTDGDLLERFVTRGEHAAFEELVRRHGGMVQRVCHRTLGQMQDAEDAFQATFMVLARNASTIIKRGSVGS